MIKEVTSILERVKATRSAVVGRLLLTLDATSIPAQVVGYPEFAEEAKAMPQGV